MVSMVTDLILDKVLGAYLRLGERKLDFSSGTLTIKNVAVREDVLDGLGLPVAVRGGEIGSASGRAGSQQCGGSSSISIGRGGGASGSCDGGCPGAPSLSDIAQRVVRGERGNATRRYARLILRGDSMLLLLRSVGLRGNMQVRVAHAVTVVDVAPLLVLGALGPREPLWGLESLRRVAQAVDRVPAPPVVRHDAAALAAHG